MNAYVATAFRQRCQPTTDPDIVHPSLGAYMEQVVTHCPPLAVVLRAHLLRWSSYDAGPRHGPHVFASLVEAAEDVRRRRLALGVRACAAVAVFGPRTEQHADDLLGPPVWVAHRLYAQVGLTFGAFNIGAERADRRGRMLAAPAVSFVVARPAVPPLDVELMARGGDGFEVPAADDDGRDVFLSALGVPASVETARRNFRRLVIHYAAAGAPLIREEVSV